MTIKEFVQNYNLHDSLLENIEYDKNDNSVKLTIDFCYWQQDDYAEGMSETGIIMAKFSKCSNVNCKSYRANSDEILSVSLTGEDTVTLTVFSDLAKKYTDITVTASCVSIQKL